MHVSSLVVQMIASIFAFVLICQVFPYFYFNNLTNVSSLSQTRAFTVLRYLRDEFIHRACLLNARLCMDIKLGVVFIKIGVYSVLLKRKSLKCTVFCLDIYTRTDG